MSIDQLQRYYYKTYARFFVTNDSSLAVGDIGQFDKNGHFSRYIRTTFRHSTTRGDFGGRFIQREAVWNSNIGVGTSYTDWISRINGAAELSVTTTSKRSFIGIVTDGTLISASNEYKTAQQALSDALVASNREHLPKHIFIITRVFYSKHWSISFMMKKGWSFSSIFSVKQGAITPNVADSLSAAVQGAASSSSNVLGVYASPAQVGTKPKQLPCEFSGFRPFVVGSGGSRGRYNSIERVRQWLGCGPLAPEQKMSLEGMDCQKRLLEVKYFIEEILGFSSEKNQIRHIRMHLSKGNYLNITNLETKSRARVGKIFYLEYADITNADEGSSLNEALNGIAIRIAGELFKIAHGIYKHQRAERSN